MAIPHAKPGEIIDVRPLGPAVSVTKTSTLVKTEFLEVLRVVLPKGKEIPTHQVLGEITIQCLEGYVEVMAGTTTRDLQPGQMIYLPGGEPHALKGLEDSSVLVTILLD
jgi:quercetin dioxygenase-like cupin family protein